MCDLGVPLYRDAFTPSTRCSAQAVVRLDFDRQAAPLEAFLATCVEKRRGENKVKRAKRAKVVAAQAAAAATEEPQAPQPPLGPALLGPQPI